VFYSIGSGKIIVEDRMLKRFPSREQDISWYVEEAILGSALPGVWPLFPKGVKLRSLLLRDGVVYADFSEEAALPPEEGMDVFSNLQILYAGIRRNFSVVRDVRFFIMGKAVFFEEFKKIFDEESKKRS
jgi:spore germination protein GerM